MTQHLVSPILDSIDSEKSFLETASSRVHYRDAMYIRKDIISTLMDHGQLNQSRLISRCNLNYAKHKGMLDDLVEKGMIFRSQRKWGNSFTIEYRISEKGIQFLSHVMQPYEKMFPRESTSIV